MTNPPAQLVSVPEANIEKIGNDQKSGHLTKLKKETTISFNNIL
jgi:hypothetical protein